MLICIVAIVYMTNKFENISSVIKRYIPIIIFLFIGVTSAIIDVGSLYILKKFFSLGDIIAISIAFLLGLIFNYICNTYLTFKSRISKERFIRYLILVIINYLITLFLINILIELFTVNIILAKIISLPIIVVISYSVSKSWVYK